MVINLSECLGVYVLRRSLPTSRSAEFLFWSFSLGSRKENALENTHEKHCCVSGLARLLQQAKLNSLCPIFFFNLNIFDWD